MTQPEECECVGGAADVTHEGSLPQVKATVEARVATIVQDFLEASGLKEGQVLLRERPLRSKSDTAAFLKGQLASTIVLFVEEHYPASATFQLGSQEKLLFRFDFRPAAAQVSVYESWHELPLPGYQGDVQSNGSRDTITLTLNQMDDPFYAWVREVIELRYRNYSSTGDAFGCCSLYAECSDARRCLHDNLLYSRKCQYRKNLEAGIVFYGDNASTPAI
ncbi:MAG: hypothetical protein LBR21_05255 [Propionibacteriaceae bacterium]|jgi:hypothetical protein|nr:hypothetical protein [Propionibacteriaceae bacterium]